MLKDRILKELIENKDEGISGQLIADRYGVSRNAVWKAVKSLREDGYAISSVTNKGYRLISDNDILSEYAIRAALREEYRDIPIYIFESIDSTNNEAKRRLADNDDTERMLIVSEGQTNGRGRYGKSFYSPFGSGIYMSLVFRVSGMTVEPQSYTRKAVVAVIKAVRDSITDEKLSIRGINDIYYDGKKAGGILTEAVSGLETGHIEHVIAGIGVNLFTESFPEDIEDRAISLNIKGPVKNNLIARIVNELLLLYEAGTDTGYEKEYTHYKNNLTDE